MKFTINFSANLTAFLLSVFLSVWMTPFIVKTLGVEAFGFVHLTQNVINYFSIITVALRLGCRSVLFCCCPQGRAGESKCVYQQLFSGLCFDFIAALAAACGFGFFIDRVMNVPQALLADVRLSILIGSVLFILTFLMAGFGAAPFYANRLYITSSIQAVQMLIRVLSVLLLFACFAPKIWQIQLAALAGAVIASVLSFYFFKKLIPWFSFRMKDLSFRTSKEPISSWRMEPVNQIGVLLFLQIDLLTANLMLGASASGKYAAIIQFPLLLRSLAGTVASLFAPIMTSYYSKGDMDGLMNYANKAVRLNGLLLALPAALLGGLAGPFLTIWLGPSFSSIAPLLFIHAGYLVVSLAFMPLFYIWTAFNQQKTPAIVTLLLGAVNVVLAVTLSGPAHLGLYGITLAGAISLILKNAIFTPLYVSRITGYKKHVFFKGIIGPLSAAVFAWTVCKAIQFIVKIDSWPSLIATGVTVSFFYAVFAFMLVCTKEERQLVLKRFRKTKGACESLILKRLFDLTAAIFLLCCTSVIILFTIAVVRLKIGSPVFFKQVRPGLHGKPFTLYKFRTMTDERDGEGNLLPDEVRLTKTGRLIRKLSIDEPSAPPECPEGRSEPCRAAAAFDGLSASLYRKTGTAP